MAVERLAEVLQHGAKRVSNIERRGLIFTTNTLYMAKGILRNRDQA
jgi:hypothetical protein